MTPLYDEFKLYLRNRRFKEAAFLAEQAAAAGGRDASFWLNQQALATMRMNNPREAIRIAEQALAGNPASYYSQLIRAEALYIAGDTNGSLAGFKEALRYPAIEERARRGILDCMIKLQRFDEALAIIAIGNNDAATMYPYKVKALSGLGRIDDAIAVCGEWLSRSIDDRTALWLLCDLEVRRDGITPVLSKYERMAKTPSRPPIYGELCAMLYKKAGNVNRELGQYDRLSAKNDNPFIVRRKAFSLAKSGKETEAIPVFEELLRQNPDDQYVNNAYIAAARRAGYLQKARTFYHELIGKFPEVTTIYTRASKIAREMNQFRNG